MYVKRTTQKEYKISSKEWILVVYDEDIENK
jgi:hypothetical protein